jgi:hypothetical protein
LSLFKIFLVLRRRMPVLCSHLQSCN